MRSSGDCQDHIHTKPGQCNPRAEDGDLQPLVYIWSQNPSLHRNKTYRIRIPISHCFVNDIQFPHDFK